MGKRVLWMLVMLVFLALSSGPAVAGEPAGVFNDVTNHWAAGDIEKCRVYQLMSGYPGNLFMPDRNLSRAEALAVIGKGLGWDRQAGNVSTDGIKFPDDLWEGFRNYIAYAASKQLFTRDDSSSIKFNDPATRMEMVLWLSRVFDLTGPGTNLAFMDLAGISAGERDRLAGVVEAGIMKGEPGNLFNPSGYLTRAEMAAIMVKLVDNGKIVPSTGGKATVDTVAKTGVKGYVISKYSDHFTVYIDFGAVENVRLSDVSLLIDGNSTTYGSLRRGAPVELFKSGSKVTEVSILDGSSRVFGRVRDVKESSIVIENEDGKTAVIDIKKGAEVIDVNGAEIEIEDISDGLNAELLLSDGYSVNNIKLYQSTEKKLQGRVESIDTSGRKRVTVLESGKRQSFYLAEGVVVREDSLPMDLEDIKKGMDLSLTLDENGNVTGIEVIDLRTVAGKVAAVEPEGVEKITVRDRDGVVKTFYVAVGVVVREGSSTLDLEDLDEGDDVRVTLGDDGRVTGIEVVDLSTVEGRVTGIRTSGARWMVVEEDNGREEVYYVDSSANASEGGISHGFDFVKEGMRVRLTLNALGNVERVDVTGVQSVTGVVTGIQSSVKKISLKDMDGTARAFYLAEGAVVRDGGRILKLDDLLIGDSVRVNLDNDGQVVAIEVAGLSMVEGEVDYIRPHGVARIDIIKSGGIKESYYLYSEIKVREGAIERSLGDIIKGMRVKITIDGQGNVTGIEIVEKTVVEGVVKAVPKYAAGKIGIVKGVGQEELYDIADNVLVLEGNNGHELGYISEGMRVRLLLDGDRRATRIDILGYYTVQGKVALIRSTAPEATVIVIRDAGGGEKTYEINKDVSVSQGGSARSLSQVNGGIDVEMTLDSSGKVSHIEVL